MGISSILVTICFLAVTVSAPEPGAEELLSRYAESLNKIESFIMKCEDSTQSKSSDYGTFDTHNLRIIRTDGDRFYRREYEWDKNSSGKVDESMGFAMHLFDGIRSFSYSCNGKDKPPESDVLSLADVTARQGNMLNMGYGGASTRGLFGPDKDRIDVILRNASSLTVQPRLENVGKATCYVLKGTAKSGTYTLWLDPEHGYLPAKATVRRTAGARVGEWILPKGFTMYSSVEIVRFENIDGIWTPMEVDVRANNSSSKSKETVQAHHKVIEIELNPNHDMLGSFEPKDIRNGTKVAVMGTLGFGYTWKGGKIVPKTLNENAQRSRAVFDDVDNNNDGALSPEEFAAYLSRTELPAWAKGLLKSRHNFMGVSQK